MRFQIGNRIRFWDRRFRIVDMRFQIGNRIGSGQTFPEQTVPMVPEQTVPALTY